MNTVDGWTIGLPGLVLLLAILGFAWRRSYLKRRRRRSHRQDSDGVHVWIELDGTPRSSRSDPREDWDRTDAADSDGGDGGGGD
jgi:hypothetical protein